MERPPKELRAAAAALYQKPPSPALVKQYGGKVEDYMPEIDISAATVEIYNVFVDLETQWRPSFGGGSVGLDYSAIAFVLDAHGVEDKRQALRDIRVMEAAALRKINSET